jgi:hypothetical protein
MSLLLPSAQAVAVRICMDTVDGKGAITGIIALQIMRYFDFVVGLINVWKVLLDIL